MVSLIRLQTILGQAPLHSHHSWAAERTLAGLRLLAVLRRAHTARRRRPLTAQVKAE